jgi:hypothetical protein
MSCHRRKPKDDCNGSVAHRPTLSVHAGRVTFAGAAAFGAVADRYAGPQAEQERRESDEAYEEGGQSVPGRLF